MSDLVLTDSLVEFEEAYLDLEFEIASRFYSFVFDSPADARRFQKLLFRGQACEFGPPWARQLLLGGRPAGLYAAIPGSEIGMLRLKAGVRVLRDPLGADARTRDRLRLSGGAFLSPEGTDFYLSRIGVAEQARGQGLGRWLLGRVLEDGTKRGFRRCVLEVGPTNSAAVALYRSLGFQAMGEHGVVDPHSGRSLASLWMAADLGAE